MSRSLKSVRIIKRIVLSLALLVSGFVIGCGSGTRAEDNGFNMEYLGSDLINWVGDFYLYEDEETGVEYIVYTTDKGAAITPRLYTNGTPYIYEGD